LSNLPTPTRSDYTFNGWYIEETGGTEVSTDTVFTEDKTVYARWTANAVNAFTVTFNTNGGNAVSSQKVNSGNKAAKPSDLKRNGYTFGGWYANSACTTAFNFNGSITSNITIYAKWNSVTQTKLGDMDGKPGISISDALEIFKYLAGMKSKVMKGTNAWSAALITPASQKSGTEITIILIPTAPVLAEDSGDFTYTVSDGTAQS
jgi:uncharacterized repeat protein (TIGR02543 family)